MMYDLFDTFFTTPWVDTNDYQKAEKKLYGQNAKNLMQTDIKEFDNGFELIMDLPGFKKEEVQAALEKGYLTVTATKGVEEEENSGGKYIRRERYTGSCQRSFYVGEYLRQEDIKAKFEQGILRLTIPKKDQQRIENNKYIAIE